MIFIRDSIKEESSTARGSADRGRKKKKEKGSRYGGLGAAEEREPGQRTIQQRKTEKRFPDRRGRGAVHGLGDFFQTGPFPSSFRISFSQILGNAPPSVHENLQQKISYESYALDLTCQPKKEGRGEGRRMAFPGQNFFLLTVSLGIHWEIFPFLGWRFQPADKKKKESFMKPESQKRVGQKMKKKWK